MAETVRRTLLALTLAALLGPAVPARAECTLGGRVQASGLPLPDCTVTLTRNNQGIAATTTGTDGTFRLGYSEFPSQLRGALLTVTAPNHSPDKRLYFRTGNSACLDERDVEIVLERATGAPEDFSHLGLTIFVAPYTIFGDGADEIAQRFNSDLPQIVHHRIVAYKSLLEVPTTGMDISVDRVDQPLTSAQGELIRRVGHELNALAVIAGDGEIVGGPAGEQQLDLTSVFRTIPVYKNHETIMQPIRDHIPARRVSPSRIAERMQDLWGKQAVLSYALQRLATRQGPWKPGELSQLQQLLIGVRDTMTREDRLLPALESLLATLQAEESS